jgi:tRNA pseudouridine55 synthase
MDGLLLIDKPAGWSSFDAVAKVRGILKVGTGQKVKVGHTGTLDPLATGLLVLTVGTYCRRAQEFSGMDKTYEAAMTLGMTSTTGDDEGDKTPVSSRIPSEEEVQEALKKFEGDIMQTPPAYSAIKVGGKRAYQLARAGKQVNLEPRPARINSLTLSNYSYPTVTFVASVGSGTYIRSLVEDIGDALGTGAYMSGLRRTRVGNFDLKDAVGPEHLTFQQIQQLTKQ